MAVIELAVLAADRWLECRCGRFKATIENPSFWIQFIGSRHANPQHDVNDEAGSPDEQENQKKSPPDPCRERSMLAESAANARDLLVPGGLSQVAHALPEVSLLIHHR